MTLRSAALPRNRKQSAKEFPKFPLRVMCYFLIVAQVAHVPRNLLLFATLSEGKRDRERERGDEEALEKGMNVYTKRDVGHWRRHERFIRAIKIFIPPGFLRYLNYGSDSVYSGVLERSLCMATSLGNDRTEAGLDAGSRSRQRGSNLLRE